MSVITSRRKFIKGLAAGGAVLNLKHSPITAAQTSEAGYRRFEDLYRNKWTWDRLARGTHGTNCAGNCAFNVYTRIFNPLGEFFTLAHLSAGIQPGMTFMYHGFDKADDKSRIGAPA